MKEIKFTKMVASGNDFVIVDSIAGNLVLTGLARKICDRKYGVGADGLLVLEESRKADIRMRIFNADGSEAQMCGNGARCSALYMGKKESCIETRAGIIQAELNAGKARIKLTTPKNITLGIALKAGDRDIKVNFINTGVPHAVIFVEGLEKIDVLNLGRFIRYHKRFMPAGTNVDFVEILSNSSIKVRTYERGVEDETLACGTGAVAAALLSAIRYPLSAIYKMNVHTKSGEILKVYFERIKNKFRNVWLEGKVRMVHKGVYYV